MDQKKQLLRQLNISLMILKQTFLLLRAVSFFSMFFLLSCLLFPFVNFARDAVFSMYPTWLRCLSSSICRSQMFLICNGLLFILLIKRSSRSTLPPEECDHHHDDIDAAADNMKLHLITKSEVSDQQITVYTYLDDADQEEQNEAEAAFGTSM